jgi:hypothetical protein
VFAGIAPSIPKRSISSSVAKDKMLCVNSGWLAASWRPIQIRQCPRGDGRLPIPAQFSEARDYLGSVFVQMD